jgi:DNA-binding winged helix-turn-helix (wHTH) protein/tetratricopeptide (TPR) repeat protein
MTPSPIFTFGPFELDAQSGELRKQGLRIRLAEQPRSVLRLLLQRPGEVVSREEIQQRLWPEGTFVDFDAGLSSAVRKLRAALGDTAEHPRFIETIPRHGYRFIAPVRTSTPPPLVEAAPPSAAPPSTPTPSRAAGIAWTMTAVLTLLLVVFASIWSMPRVNDEANTAFLNGVAAAGRENAAGFRTAVAYFEEATRKQPDFALAYARLAEAQLQLVFVGQFAPRDMIPAADVAVRKALALDDGLALAHRMRGAILHDYLWEWEAGDSEIQRAIALDSKSADMHTHRALALAEHNRFDEAADEAARARTLDPRSARAALTLATVLREAGHYDDALREFDRALGINPQMARGHFQRGVTFALMHRWPEAIEALEHARQLSPDNTRFLAYLGLACAKAGRIEDARGILDELSIRSHGRYVSSFGLALIADALGEREAALTGFERALDEHAIELSQWDQYPPVQSVQREPRYEAVAHRVLRKTVTIPGS